MIFDTNGTLPMISPSVYFFLHYAYGSLLFIQLILAGIQAKRFFLSEKWEGYGDDTRFVSTIQNPWILPLVYFVWIACSIGIFFHVVAPWAGFINLLLCRYFFISMRWRGLLRGMGAPGFLLYWMGVCVFFLETAVLFIPTLLPLVLFVFQMDFAVIILAAGIYKMSSGYMWNCGMELGMVNPEWGYWWKSFSKLSPNHLIFRMFNHLGWSMEILAALLMLIPPTRFLGGVLIMASFIFIALQIRLTFLCEVVMLCGVLYFFPGSLGDKVISRILPNRTFPSMTSIPYAETVSWLFSLALWGYVFILPFAYGTMYYNFYTKKTLFPPLQKGMEKYINFFGMILWRVFTVDLTNFYIRIHAQNKTKRSRILLSTYGKWNSFRFNHVGESITITSLFTGLKYYPSQHERFEKRLFRYAKTIPHQQDEDLVFEYVSIIKSSDRFVHKTVAEFTVDVDQGRIMEEQLSNDVDIRSMHNSSPAFEGCQPGSYVPLKG